MSAPSEHQVYRCPGCGSPASRKGVPCEYCNTLTMEYLEPDHSHRILSNDFGYTDNSIQWFMVLTATLLSVVSCFLNDQYFLDSTAVIFLRFVIIPLLTMLAGFLTRSATAVFLPFISLFISVGGITFLITVIRMNRFSYYWGYLDDSLGLGVITGSAAAGAYLSGIFLHWFARYAKRTN